MAHDLPLPERALMSSKEVTVRDDANLVPDTAKARADAEQAINFFDSKPDYQEFLKWASGYNFEDQLDRGIREVLSQLKIHHYQKKLEKLKEKLYQMAREKKEYREILKTMDKYRKIISSPDNLSSPEGDQ